MSNYQDFSDLSPKMKFFISTIFPLILGLLGGILFLVYLPGMIHAQVSKGWPNVTGKIIKSEEASTRSDARRKGKFFPLVQYAYSVNGTDYIGDKVVFGTNESRNALRARKVIQRYPIGKEVRVYYKPENPGTSLLERGKPWQAFYIPGYGILFMLAGGVLALSVRANKSFPK